MSKRSPIAAAAVFVALSCSTALVLAQSAPPTPPAAPMKQIGARSSHHTQTVPSLIVMNARGATMEGGKLTLVGVAPNSIVFADRPVRAAGHDLTAHLLEEWAPNNADPESFTKNPPNATISVFKKDGSTVLDAVVVLKTPKAEGDRLTFDVDVLEGDLTGGDGPASVFIDIIGRPFTPLSFAGAARRTAFRRGAWYAGAAGAAAVAAAAAAPYYYHPYYAAPPPPPPPYYPYPYYRPY